MKNCSGCSQTLELRKFYFKKTEGKYFSRCMTCTRKSVTRRYHLGIKKSKDHACEQCLFFSGNTCVKQMDRPWKERLRAEKMKDEDYRSWHKACFVKMSLTEEKSA